MAKAWILPFDPTAVRALDLIVPDPARPAAASSISPRLNGLIGSLLMGRRIPHTSI
jgi:hypothetical protein